MFPVALILFCHDPNDPPNAPVEATYDATGGVFTGDNPLLNSFGGNGTYMPPFVPGDYVLHMHTKFPSGCEHDAYATAHVTW